MERKKALEKIAQAAGFRPGRDILTRLRGDASTRMYFRLKKRKSAPVVVALYPEPFDVRRFDFLEIGNLLAEAGFHVPAVLDMNPGLGVLVLEDLGDLTAQRFLAAATRREGEAFYRRAVKILAALQKISWDSRTRGHVALKRSFTHAKFMEELDLFYRTFIQGIQGRKCTKREELLLFEGFEWIAGRSLSGDKIFCHRDFHVRNILIHKGKLYLLDFQDARLGPPAYDPASILYDAYYRLNDRFRNELISFLIKETGKDKSEGSRFRRNVLVVALQRNLKAIGTFASQSVLRQNHNYLRYIPRTMAYVLENMTFFPELENFSRVLSKTGTSKQRVSTRFSMGPSFFKEE